METAMYDIIIAHYGEKHLTDYCLSCLATIRHFSTDYRLIFIDNASPEFELIRPELELHPHKLIRNNVNLGFIKAVNQGLAISNAPRVVLLNNDTEVCAGWLEKLTAPLLHGASMSGPRTDTKGSWQGHIPAGVGWELISTQSMLAFFCTMFKREVFDKIGFLDEDFGVGFGDDDNFCWKAHQAGFRLALVKDLLIHHKHRSTFKHIYGDGYKEMQVEALKLFKEKQAAK